MSPVPRISAPEITFPFSQALPVNRLMGVSLLTPLRLVLLASTLLLGGCDAVREIILSISDGAACSSDSACLGGTCLGEEEGFPGGYCTTRSCDTEGCSNIFGSECIELGALGATCFLSCSSRNPCRDGYECLSIETRNVCLPADFAAEIPRAGGLGTACARAADCDTGTCLTNLIGGYCSLLDCDGDESCPGEGRCLPLEDADAEADEADPTDEAGEASASPGDGTTDATAQRNGDSRTACFAPCRNDEACRFGYRCEDPDGQGGVCRPVDADERSPVRNPAGADDGAPCTVDINCKGGTCLPDAADYPSGYCTTLNCAQVGCNAPSGREGVCRSFSESTACFVGCAQDADCRAGYACIEGDEGASGFCAPRIEAPTPDESEGIIGNGESDLRVSCQSESISGGRRIRFNIDAETVSFAVVPYSATDQVRPLRLLGPGGDILADFRGDHAFQAINPEILVNIAPTFFPAAPQFVSIVEEGGGEYVMDVATRDSRPCFYVIEKRAAGRALDVNFYFVGAPNLSAATAEGNADFQRMMTVFRRIYDEAGINIRTVRYNDVTGQNLERYRVIRSFNDIFGLASISQDPGPSLRERLSINVFIIQGFSISQAPGLLGVSLGIPGVPGFHGNLGSGLIFTSEYLPADPEGTGQTLAHEIGHFMGLRHTTEHGGQEADPLEDTPRCSNPDRGANCPDASNFMFPFSLRGVTQEQVSGGQSFVLRRSPFSQR